MIGGIGSFKTIGLASFASLAAGVAIGWAILGYPHGHRAGQKIGYAQREAEYDGLKLVAAKITGERQQCYGEIEKVNAEIDRQREENRLLLIRDKTATEVAVDRVERAAVAAVQEATLTKIKIEESRDALKKLADTCVAAGVPSDFVGVLNSILAAPAADDGGGQVPGK